MVSIRLKSLCAAVFSVCVLFFYQAGFAQAGGESHPEGQQQEAGEKLEPGDLIMEHISDAHEFHFGEVGHTHLTIPLPVLLYSPQRGWDFFSYSKFEHGHATHSGYKSEEGKIVPIKADGSVDESVKVYDFSLTRNVVQMLIALTLLTIILLSVAKRYQRKGANVAPTGLQNAVEPIVVFIRDEVGKANLGHKYKKYMPYLLTVFFFILINNLIGLIPGSANVTGNIAFTLVLAVISLIVILFSSNRHYWLHMVWPPGVPVFVKIILIPIELASNLLIKPASLMIRLFANMVAGHIVITCFILLIFIFGAMSKAAGAGFTVVSVAFTVFIYFIEILVALIQAFIFTNLTAVFLGQAIEDGHHGDDHHHGQDKELPAVL